MTPCMISIGTSPLHWYVQEEPSKVTYVEVVDGHLYQRSPAPDLSQPAFNHAEWWRYDLFDAQRLQASQMTATAAHSSSPPQLTATAAAATAPNAATAAVPITTREREREGVAIDSDWESGAVNDNPMACDSEGVDSDSEGCSASEGGWQAQISGDDEAIHTYIASEKVLWVGEGGLAAIYLIVIDAPSKVTRAWKQLHFCKLRLVQFQHGRTVCGWCTHPGCSGDDVLEQLYDEPANYATVVGASSISEQSLCRHARSLLDKLGGQSAVESDWAEAAIFSDRDVQQHHFGRKIFGIVRLNTSLAACAVLYMHGDKYMCGHGSCERHKGHCVHMQAWDESAASGEAAAHNKWLSEVAWEAKLDNVLDPETGCRKLTCISRKPIAEHPTGDVLQHMSGAPIALSSTPVYTVA